MKSVRCRPVFALVLATMILTGCERPLPRKPGEPITPQTPASNRFSAPSAGTPAQDPRRVMRQ